MRVQRLCSSLLALLTLSACSIQVKDTEVCAAAGLVSAGASCAHTLSDDHRELSFEQFIDFLEPQPQRPNPSDPKTPLPARGAALCMSPDDWNSLKTSLEEACKKLGGGCSYEMKQKLSDASSRVQSLEERVAKRRAAK